MVAIRAMIETPASKRLLKEAQEAIETVNTIVENVTIEVQEAVSEVVPEVIESEEVPVDEVETDPDLVKAAAFLEDTEEK